MEIIGITGLEEGEGEEACGEEVCEEDLEVEDMEEGTNTAGRYHLRMPLGQCRPQAIIGLDPHHQG